LLDNFTFLGFITQTVVNPNVPWGNNINAFSYQLFGGISPKKTTYKLKVNNNAYGNISSDAPFQGKINCGNSNNTCAINFDIKSSVKLTATPNTGYKFVSWSGDCSITLSQSCLVTMDAAKNVTAKFAPITQKPLAIGQSYQGGIIFYLDNTKQHGLIAAPTDFKNVAGAWNVSGAYLINTGWTGIIDSNSQYSFIPPISNCDWQYNFATGHYYDTGISCPYLGVTDTAIGTGQSNTKKIVTTRGNGIYAAKLCDDLVLNGYDDWFLPSLDELNTMYLNIGRGANNSGGFLDNFYWSSSEVSDNSVYKGFGYFGIWLFEDFSIGFQFYGDTGLRNSVRAVRAF
jgi:hypothetical protein